MKCENAEQLIFQYAELSESERNALKAHLEGCSKCSVSFTVNRMFTEHLQVLSTEKIMPLDQNRLTEKIMVNLKKSEMAGEQSGGSGLSFIFFRRLMSALSVSLILLFVIETGALTASSEAGGNTPNKDALLSEQGLSRLKNRKKKNTVSLYAMIRDNGIQNKKNNIYENQ
ncbi:zf-HC2 domain-containing protein [Fulvivirga sedimenti]|uniref:Zf-HC2 domain-containing protein n=1 Tax=Fulvivirga sedimenti TaxID=2879465 RepID=A0A9X1HL45_9BACT|nr:zf-HC2 domain-containing protein [Fulvivirga sedimenti]MCA6074259.1 zf-HC2 domain-containing protein [Fulvivirga sedimenti]